MSGIVHKESLPGQGHIKRRRVDTPASAEVPAAEKMKKEPSNNAAPRDQGKDKNDNAHAPLDQREKAKLLANGAKPAPASSSTSNKTSSDDDEDNENDDDEIERENARLAKLREQRCRRQEQSPSGGANATTKLATEMSAITAGAHSYDHDVLFRNAAWRHAAKPTTSEKKQKEKWSAVLNRTQDSAAHRHFIKQFFK